METLGTLTDKLGVTNLKMWNNQEFLYEIRRSSYAVFCRKFGIVWKQADEIKPEGTPFELYTLLKKCCDLNVQRNNLINEVDEKVIEMFKKFAACMGMDDGKINNTIAILKDIYSIKPHKSY